MKQNDIKLNCSFSNKQEVLEKIMEHMKISGISNEYIDSIPIREQEASFNIGNQIAIPHGTYEASKLLTNSKIFVWHLKEKLLWDDEYVSLIIALAIKDNDQLEILQNIAINSQDDEFFLDLLKNPTNEKIISLMTGA